MALYTYIFEGALVHTLYTALTICINNCIKHQIWNTKIWNIEKIKMVLFH